MEISVIKDVVYIFASTAGVTLGLLGYIKSRQTERRVIVEPYFKGVWKKLSKEIGGQIHESERWISKIESELRVDNPERITYNPPTPEVLRIDGYDWKYDKKLFNNLEKYIHISSMLGNEVSKYNRYRYPTTEAAGLYIGLERIGFDRETEGRETIEKVVEEFNLPLESTNIDNLKKHEPYIHKVELHLSGIKLLVKELDSIVDEIQRKKSVYDFTFEVEKK